MTKKYLGFPLSSELEQRVEEVINDIQEASNKRQYALKLFQAINDLSDVGLDYYFIQSLRTAGLGKIKMIAIENAIKMNKKAILTIGKGIIKGMNDNQLLIIANIIESSITISPKVEA
ncbi:hypothetical protein OAK19_05970 [Aureispira]|nr:hypothetical protein [Aureispira sp.]